MKPLKVFVVDDDPDFAEGIALTLEFAGYETAFAASGLEAIEKHRQEDFDVTLMDVRMPGMNGVESYFEIRKMKPDAKIVMMTAYSAQQLLEQAVEGGAAGVLHKPISEKDLLTTIQAARGRGIILIADDDPEFAEGLEGTLRDEGYSVIVARDGAEAVKRASSEKFDVMLLDLKLPVLDGLEVYKELVRRNIEKPTFIVTGYAKEEVASIEALKSMAVDRCLTKPVNSKALLGAIEELLAASTEQSVGPAN